MRLADAIPGWGTSPSPAISLDVSIMTTRLCATSASMLDMSLMAVVLPTPGLPSRRIDLPDRATSAAMFALPAIALPTRHVNPTITPSLLRMQLIRCRHLSMPARLSPPKSLTCVSACKCWAQKLAYTHRHIHLRQYTACRQDTCLGGDFLKFLPC